MKNTSAQVYEAAKEKYRLLGVDTDAAIQAVGDIKLSLQCWQGDDVRGFLFRDNALSGGIQATGSYPGAASTPDELRRDIEKALSLIPGKHKVSLHSMYADTTEKVDLDALEPSHFQSWVDWARDAGLGLDFNPTCFMHPMAKSGFTVSSADPAVRGFWIEHCKRCRRIGEYFGRALDHKSVVNFWFPDGYKDNPIDTFSPRERMCSALDEIFEETIAPAYELDALESKLFGIGVESYTVGSNELMLGYAVRNGKAVCLDAGHFHPTEYISDKIPSVLMFTDELLLHVSRPVRWDSDHVVILDDELLRIAQSLIRSNMLGRTHIGLDYFDASINRIAAWVIGARSVQKALLRALLEPVEVLKRIELSGDYTSRLAITEELKSYPFSIVWDRFCEVNDVTGAWLREVKKYESDVLSKR